MRDLAILQRMAMGKLRVQFSCDALASMVDLGNACVSLAPKDRPTAAEVLFINFIFINFDFSNNGK
ncbi:hypothetical protein L915_01658 [Phytophthora nicotianae]|nr:hypothetical protein L915_01658 [Phytophthora nicotianae]ETL48799.1 hypothetical protein L916_01633 [Phytophthora nicotianae]